MPNRDGTGPEGKGSKTGRQMGNCDGAEAQESFEMSRRCGRRPRGCGRRQGN